MPAILPFLPAIASLAGVGATLYGGYKTEQANKANLARGDQALARQDALITQMMSGITPQAYQNQAAQAGQSALSQLAANFASRGMLSSGALHTAGADTLARLQTDANAKYMQDRAQAYQMALGGQQSIAGQYLGRINPDPYGGLGTALGAVGTAGANWLEHRYGRPTPQQSAYPSALPGFGVKYPGRA